MFDEALELLKEAVPVSVSPMRYCWNGECEKTEEEATE
ncbi:hypothetical protein SAMN04488564_13011 [Lentzea waywayandensis]|uniref:Uncharacterized protein n=1 Tax=Lentzea waywayandensis TaxID=84724 RepID=A0A1I6FJP6_9PSEU|nr:hypothetical protein SAMN04488564_13011 [Lentzea waywayandensis]